MSAHCENCRDLRAALAVRTVEAATDKAALRKMRERVNQMNKAAGVNDRQDRNPVASGQLAEILKRQLAEARQELAAVRAVLEDVNRPGKKITIMGRRTLWLLEVWARHEAAMAQRPARRRSGEQHVSPLNMGATT